MEVFELTSGDDYAGYGCSSAADEEKFGFLGKQLSLPSTGDPPLRLREVRGEVHAKRAPKRGDLHSAYGNIRLVSSRAIDALGAVLRASGLLFPVEIEGRDEPFFWYWCTTVIDCIDESRTKRGGPSSLPVEARLIINPAFYPERIGQAEIFVPLGQSRQFDLFVTDKFRDRVKAAKLRGFKFARGRFDPKPWVS